MFSLPHLCIKSTHMYEGGGTNVVQRERKSSQDEVMVDGWIKHRFFTQQTVCVPRETKPNLHNVLKLCHIPWSFVTTNQVVLVQRHNQTVTVSLTRCCICIIAIKLHSLVIAFSETLIWKKTTFIGIFTYVSVSQPPIIRFLGRCSIK